MLITPNLTLPATLQHGLMLETLSAQTRDMNSDAVTVNAFNREKFRQKARTQQPEINRGRLRQPTFETNDQVVDCRYCGYDHTKKKLSSLW